MALNKTGRFLLCRLRWANLCLAFLTILAQTFPLRGQTKPSNEIGKWTPRRIAAAQAWREETLQRSSMSYSETVWITRPDGSEDKYLTRDFETKFRPGRISYKFSVTEPNVPELNRKDVRESWDGREGRSLSAAVKPRMGERYNAWVGDTVPDAPSTNGFLSVIGFRYCLDPDSLSVTLSKRLMKPAYFTSAVTESTQAGERRVVLTLTEKDDRSTWEYTFLPDKDFVLEKRVQTTPRRNGKIYVDTIEATHLSQMSGIWVPEKSTIFGKGRDVDNRIECVLHSLNLVEPTDDEMTVSFPPDTRVNDRIRNQIYILRADGTKEQQRFLDAETGKIIEPPTTSPTK